MAKLAMSPSSAAKITNLADQQKKYPVLNGRPEYLTSLPIQLYHPVFSAFDEFVHSTDVTADANDYAIAHALLVQSAALYTKEGKREEVIIPLLNEALQRALVRIVNANGTGSDSCHLTKCGKYLKALAFLEETKNEIGAGGCDPFIQAGFSFREFWSEDAVGCPPNICHYGVEHFRLSARVFEHHAVVPPSCLPSQVHGCVSSALSGPIPSAFND